MDVANVAHPVKLKILPGARGGADMSNRLSAAEQIRSGKLW